MADIAVTASFNSGEWSPALFARVDVQKYHSAAALLQNFFVDYRGGASTRAGTKYIIQAKDSAHPVRLISFQAAFNIGYILEFGQDYLRFIFQGSTVLENTKAITGATAANPCVLTIVSSGYVIGDWIFVSGVGGMTQLNGRYFIVTNVSGSSVTIGPLTGGGLNATGYTAYTSGGTAQRVYTIVSPYAAADLALLKFTQSQDEMIFTHPNYAPYVLTLISATNWTLAPIVFGSTANTPTGVNISTTLPPFDIFIVPGQEIPGSSYYQYVVSSLDAGGQESLPSTPATLGPRVDIRTAPGGGSNRIQWNPSLNAVAYNVYEAEISYFGAQPPGVMYGFIGVCNGTQFTDSNIGPDFTTGPQIVKNPFVGSGVSFYTVTAAGTYTTVPGVTITGGSPIVPASATAQLSVQGTPTITGAGTGFAVGDIINFGNGLVISVVTLSGSTIASWAVDSPGAIYSGSTPSNPIAQVTSTGAGTGATATATWGVQQLIPVTNGDGYVSTPTVGFTSGAATATATLSATGNGNPAVCGFFQQRLVLGGSLGAPATFNMSQPGSYFNYNTTNPIAPDNSISGTLVSGTLNSIKSIVSVAAGMLLFTDKAIWVVNGGGGVGANAFAVTPTTIVASPHSYVGANDVPPITINYDVLFIESKGTKVRDTNYNIYYQIFTSNDISVYANHLFYGFTIDEWAWAEQPFYNVWAVRSDGVMLVLTYIKEQEFVGWSHHTTQGLFRSVATVTEPSTSEGTIDAVYTVVERVVGNQTLKYIERVAERIFPLGLQDAWCVDCGLEYTGSATTAFQGAEQLAGLIVTGLQTDNSGVTTIIPPFTMPVTGFFTLATAAVKVILGLPYTCQLQTMPLDIGEPSIQGKLKKIPYVDVRCNQTNTIQIGPDFTHLEIMKDTVPGNVSSMLTGLSSQTVSNLYTGDARTHLGSAYTIPGQYCIQQSSPYPATILGVFPAYVVGDDR